MKSKVLNIILFACLINLCSLSLYTLVSASSVINLKNNEPLISNITHMNEYFVGRQETLLNIKNRFNKHRLISITGMAGMGKTQIAFMYANQYAHHYDIIWRFDSHKNIAEQFKKLAVEINDKLLIKNKIVIERLSDSTLINRVRNSLKNSNKNYLLIFDNALSKSAIKDYIPHPAAKTINHILVTSKTPLGWEYAFKIGRFSRRESVEYINKIAPLLDKTGLNELAELLQDYPLVLTQAASYIRECGLESYKDYVALFKTRKQELWRREENLHKNRLKTADLYDDYEYTLATSVRMSVAEFDKKSELAAIILRSCAFLDHANLSEDILKSLAINKKYDSEFDLREAINILVSSSIFERISGAKKNNLHIAKPQYAMHELIQSAVRDQLTVKQQQDQIHEGLQLLIPHFTKTWDQLIFYIRDHLHLLVNAESLYEHAERLGIKSPALAHLKIQMLEYHLYGSRDMDKYEQLIKDIDKLIAEIPEIDELTLARYAIDKVYSRTIYDKAGNCNPVEEAKKINQSVALIVERHNLEKEKFRALTNAAQFYFFQGNFLEALKYIEKADSIIEKVKCVYYEGLFYYIKAWILAEHGELEKAQIVTDTLLSKTDLDWSVPLKLYVKNLKAIVFFKLGDYESALHWAAQVYDQGVEYFEGGYNDVTSETLMTLATCNLYQGNIPNAKKAILESIVIYDKYYGGKYRHADQAYAHVVFGDIFAAENEFLRAQEEYKIAEKIYNNINPTKQSDNLSALYLKLALNGIHLNDEFPIRHYYGLHKKYFGRDHPRTLEFIKTLVEKKINIPW